MSLNVLVVEDDKAMRLVIVRALHRSGLKLGAVYEAENGIDGLSLLKQKRIDFVLADINMPYMGGQEMVQKMRAEPDLHILPVVFISGESEEKIIAQIHKEGDGFIQKPFDPDMLGKMVVDLISK